jgi:hypothetical protein
LVAHNLSLKPILQDNMASLSVLFKYNTRELRGGARQLRCNPCGNDQLHRMVN